MPRIFDNIETSLLPALGETLGISDRADFCVGYFNLRGWKALDTQVERWAGGPGHCCRLLVGMQRLPQEDARALLGLVKDRGTDQATVARLKRQLVEDFREQLTVGVPTAADEAGLRRLAAQIRGGKIIVKLFLRHALHAKLYLLFRPDPVSPAVAFLGSSNLTLAGLSMQGELNIDVLDHDACGKLAGWFEDRWNDRWCLDISAELVQVIEESWARVEPVPPYLVYVKMAYHLAREAREGISDYQLPPELRGKLCAFQEAAVKIGAHHVNRRGGVLIGDVVGLGKTLMATALARLFEEEGMETLILCPSNLVAMWTDYQSSSAWPSVSRPPVCPKPLPCRWQRVDCLCSRRSEITSAAPPSPPRRNGTCSWPLLLNGSSSPTPRLAARRRRCAARSSPGVSHSSPSTPRQMPISWRWVLAPCRAPAPVSTP